MPMPVRSLGVVVDRGTATQIRQINRTNQTSNLFWFDAMFRLWAANCIAAIQAGAGSLNRIRQGCSGLI